MSEKIAQTLQDTFVELQRELANNELKKIIDSTPREISDDEEGLYQYEIPLKDGSGQLVFKYQDKDYYWDQGYFFTFIKYTPLHQGFVCSDFADSFDDELPVYQFTYNDDADEGRGEAGVTSWNEASWKGSSAKKMEKNRAAVLEAWQFLKDFEKFVTNNGDKAQEKYNNINDFLKAVLAQASMAESDIKGMDSDGYFQSIEDDIYQLTMFLEPETNARSPELVLWCSQEGIGAWTETHRHGLPITKCKNLAKAFLEEDEQIYLSSTEGRGEEGTFSFAFDYNEQLDFAKPEIIADKLGHLYRKTREFANLIKNNPDLSINDIKPVPEEYQPFADFVKKLYAILAAGAIKNLEVMPMLSDKMAWSSDSKYVEMNIPLKGDVFLLRIYCSIYGFIEMRLFEYRYGVALRTARDYWENIGNDEDISIKGKGKGETAWLSLQKGMDSLNDEDNDAEDNLKNLNAEKCINELGKFFNKTLELAQKLKKQGFIKSDLADEAIKNLQTELAAVKTSKAEQNSDQKMDCATFLSISCQPNVVLVTEDIAEEEPESGEEATPAVEIPQPVENKEAALPKETLAAFNQFALELTELLKHDPALKNILPPELSPAEVENGAPVIRLDLADSPLKLRIKYDPGENMIDAGFGARVQEGQVASFRKYGRRLKEKNKSQFSINEDSCVFISYQEEKASANKPVLEKADVFAHKVAALYEPALKLYRRLAG